MISARTDSLATRPIDDFADNAKRLFRGGAVIVLCLGIVACATTAPSPENEYHRLVRVADDLEQHGSHQMAASIYAKAAQMPTAESPAVQLRIGKARLGGGDPQGAASAYRDALRAQPGNPIALLGLGKARLQSGQPAYAVGVLEQAASDLDTVEAWSQLATARAMLGQTQRAENAFGEARRLSDSLDVQSNLALAQALAGHSDQAVSGMHAVCNSPLAETRHFRNLLLVLVLDGQDQAVDRISLPGISSEQRANLIASARQIRAISDPAEQARAIGMTVSPAQPRPSSAAPAAAQPQSSRKPRETPASSMTVPTGRRQKPAAFPHGRLSDY